MKKIKVLNVDIAVTTQDQLNGEINEALNGERIAISKVNSEFLLRSLEQEEFVSTLKNFDLNVADGIGVLWAARYLSLPILKIPIFRQIQAIWQMVYSGASLVFYPKYCRYPLPEVFRGVKMMYRMLDFAEKERTPVYLFGAEASVLYKAVENIRHKYPDLEIAGSESGYDFNNQKIIDDINASGSKMLFVALSSPIQEYWIRDNIDKLKDIKVAVGEGGSFEFIAGTFKRAPKWMRMIGTEWLWRLFTHKSLTPSGGRVRRVWNAVPVFVYTVVKFKISLVIPRNEESHRKDPPMESAT